MKENISALRECFEYRYLIYELVQRDIKVRYRRSILGVLWTILTPVCQMLVMTMVFSRLFRFEIENYVVYLLIGNILFSFMSDTTNVSIWVILENSGLIKKVYIPKILFPVTKTFSNVVNVVFSLVALVVVIIITRVPFHVSSLLIFIPIFYCMIFTMGLSALLATLTVFFRDISHIYTVFTLLWMYATPIFYPKSLLEDAFPWVLHFNPMFHYIQYFRSLVLDGVVPGLTENLICIGFALLFFAVGTITLVKKQDKFILYV